MAYNIHGSLHNPALLRNILSRSRSSDSLGYAYGAKVLFKNPVHQQTQVFSLTLHYSVGMCSLIA